MTRTLSTVAEVASLSCARASKWNLRDANISIRSNVAGKRSVLGSVGKIARLDAGQDLKDDADVRRFGEENLLCVGNLSNFAAVNIIEAIVE